MTPFVASVNQALSLLTIVGQVAIVALLLNFFVLKGKLFSFGFIARNILLLTFAVALTATLGSLFYSEIAGFEPCKLCWYQRILMYPQAILLGMALWKKDKLIGDYSIALSVLGAIIAGYHYLLQIGVVSAAPCAAVGYSASCSQRFVMNFGYITIPMMSFTAFALILVLFLGMYRSSLKEA